jgi:hypothetical protein
VYDVRARASLMAGRACGGTGRTDGPGKLFVDVNLERRVLKPKIQRDGTGRRWWAQLGRRQAGRVDAGNH